MSPLTPIDGTLAAKPFGDTPAGRLTGTATGIPTGSIGAGADESPQSAAVAELGNLIASLSTLSAQAQSLPLSPPTLPGLPQGGYQPQATDYTQLTGDSN